MIFDFVLNAAFIEPWEHLIALGIGGYAGLKLTSWEVQQQKELRDTLRSLGKADPLE